MGCVSAADRIRWMLMRLPKDQHRRTRRLVISFDERHGPGEEWMVEYRVGGTNVGVVRNAGTFESALIGVVEGMLRPVEEPDEQQAQAS